MENSTSKEIKDFISFLSNKNLHERHSEVWTNFVLARSQAMPEVSTQEDEIDSPDAEEANKQKPSQPTQSQGRAATPPSNPAARHQRKKTPIGDIAPILFPQAVLLHRVANDLLENNFEFEGNVIKHLAEGTLVKFIGSKIDNPDPKIATHGLALEDCMAVSITSQRRFKHHIDALATKVDGKSVLKRLNDLIIMARYFAVPKSSGGARAICDARLTNAFLNSPPATPLLTTEILIELLLYFDEPCFAEADLMHWFYQLGVHGEDCQYFGINIGGEKYAFSALPMGFSWAPFIGQTVSYWIAKKGFMNKAFIVEQGQGFITVRSKKQNEIIAFVCVYYDNFLVIAKDENTRNFVRDKITLSAKHYNAIWKTDEKRTQEWVSSKLNCLFLGGQFHSENGSVSWKHLDDNITKWGKKLSDLNKKNASIRELQSPAGVIVWDMALRLSRTALIPGTIEVLSKLGHQAFETKSHDSVASLTDERRSATSRRNSSACWRTRRLPSNGGPDSRMQSSSPPTPAKEREAA